MDTPAANFLTGVETAAAALRDIFGPTPLQRSDYLSEKYAADVWLKREDLSPVRSYKLRGAFNAMRKSRAARPDRTRFVCASAGNHAQGVAYACRHFGVDGVVFMPVTTPQQKIDKTRQFGGGRVEIRLVGDYFDATLSAARTFAVDADALFLPPFDDADVVEGQATCALEILEQLSTAPDLVVAPVGGGGLASGLVQIVAALVPRAGLRFVEPEGAPS